MRLLICFALLVAAASATGCRMCCAPEDPNYSAYGGRWERDDPQYGRVGSLFAPAGGPVDGEYIVEGDTYIEGESYIEDAPYSSEGQTPTPAEKKQPTPAEEADGEMAYFNSPDGEIRR